MNNFNRPPQPISPENEKELVAKIEAIKTTDDTKADIVLLWKDLKKASDIIITGDSEMTEAEREVTCREAEDLFKKLGLSYVKNNREMVAALGIAEYIVSKNQTDMLLYQKAWNQDGDTEAKTLGNLLGFPDTAIEAYQAGEVLDESMLPEDVVSLDTRAFLWYKLSKDHWQEEIKTAEKWARQIQKTDSQLYTRLIERYKKQKI